MICQLDAFTVEEQQWESFENINPANKDRFQASDHHCVWAEIDL